MSCWKSSPFRFLAHPFSQVIHYRSTPENPNSTSHSDSLPPPFRYLRLTTQLEPPSYVSTYAVFRPNGVLDIGPRWISNFPLHEPPILTSFAH
ncbi:hypothetical protein AVEN_81038-1 [Araneus ventricosus]|uniref:Uncharacterized protein n=1 Tax=Araneus ventricosus TaxID=182803 RepID=A0A4Y2N0R7_ARAVE|nr:hypothetical protein AVEN_81038-1 [Araneus ventricosus]